MKAVVLVVAVFTILSLYPGLSNGTESDHGRAIFGLTVLVCFAASAAALWVAVDDSYVELDGNDIYIRFEGFFHAEFPVADIVRVAPVDPRPRWRYRFGLSTNFVDRIGCSHGGSLIEIELAHPWRTRLWPRHIPVRRFWIALREQDAFVAELRRLSPHTLEHQAFGQRAA